MLFFSLSCQHFDSLETKTDCTTEAGEDCIFGTYFDSVPQSNLDGLQYLSGCARFIDQDKHWCTTKIESNDTRMHKTGGFCNKGCPLMEQAIGISHYHPFSNYVSNFLHILHENENS